MTMRRRATNLAARRFGPVLAVVVLAAIVVAAPLALSAPGDGDVEQRVQAILTKMTLEQKVDMLGGYEDFYVRAYPGLGVPALRMSDGPLGVRNADPPSTLMAGGISLAASWDPALAEQEGIQIGRDARARGVHFMLGPAFNIYRAPMDGRNFEYMGEDPYLAGKIAVGYIEGMQSQGVSSTAKHFVANNSEFDRHNTDSIVDERTLREIYLPAFEAAVKEAHVRSVMDSYNLTNGIHMTQNAQLNIDVLKKEWGFTGILMSDWTSTYDGVAAANAGLDIEMPSGLHMNREQLLPAIQKGLVSVATIDDKVRRILRVAIEFGWLDREQEDLSISRYNREGDEVALQAAREGAVLLKNDGNLLPLKKDEVKSVLVVGPDAYPAVPVGGGSARAIPFQAVSFLQGISNYLGNAANVFYSPGIPTVQVMAQNTAFSTAASGGKPGLHAEYFANPELQGKPYLSRIEQRVNFGYPSSENLPDESESSRWTGYYTPRAAGEFDLFVGSTGEDGGYYRVYVDGKLVLDDWTISQELLGVATLAFDTAPHKIVLEQHGHTKWHDRHLRMGIAAEGSYVLPDAKKLAAKADVVVIAAGFDPDSEAEGADRTFHLPPGQDELIQEMAAANKNVIVLLTSGGNVDMNAWLERVPALVEVWYPGQEGGKAAAEILFGDVNPSGRLPATFERRWADNPAHDSYYPALGTNRVVYKEGVFVGYRGYEHDGTKPLFPFGYGLSYTAFKYANLAIKPAAPGAKAEGLSAPLYEVSFDVTNTGAREGADVAQVYVSDPQSRVPRPPKELKGFARINLKPGETKTATVTLDSRAFSYYDVAGKQWRTDPTEYQILVGRSSDDIQLRGAVTPSTVAAATAGEK
jgi:beta-glucosidase